MRLVGLFWNLRDASFKTKKGETVEQVKLSIMDSTLDNPLVVTCQRDQLPADIMSHLRVGWVAVEVSGMRVIQYSNSVEFSAASIEVVPAPAPAPVPSGANGSAPPAPPVVSRAKVAA